MTRKIVCLLVLAMLLSAMAVAPAAAKMDPKLDAAGISSQVDQYNLHKASRQARKLDPQAGPTSGVRFPLGVSSANAGLGIGEVVDNSWDDWQNWMHNGHYVATGVDATPDAVGDVGVEVHFVYEELSSDSGGFTDQNRNSGYNFYNATNSLGSNWPEGQEAGCQLEALHDYGGGYRVSLALMPDGRATFASTTTMRGEHTGADDSTTNLDNQIFFQQDKSSFNRCYWDSTVNTSLIPPSVYQVGWVSENDSVPSRSTEPVIETQIIGSDTIIHLLLFEAGGTVTVAGYPILESQDWATISYFRKVGSATPGTWSAATVLDTNYFYGGNIAASPVSSDVAFVCSDLSPLGRLQGEENDADIYFVTSDDGGLSWNLPMTNLTQYPRNVDSYTAKYGTVAMYDSRGYLHITWTAQPCPADPYRGGYHWPDFGADFFHWSDATPGTVHGGTISLIQYASYDLNPIACSYGGYNVGYLGWTNLTECDGNLYATYNIWHVRALELGIDDPTAYDDCYAVINEGFSANAEICMNVSSSLDGLLWDEIRNLTNTYTPGCDSLGGENGPCGNEYKFNAEVYALDPLGLGTLNWPDSALVDPGVLVGLPPYTGDYYFNGIYCDDQFPGDWDVSLNSPPAFNSQKWLRIACVDPVEAPQINADPADIAWPRWQRYDEDSAYTVTVTNNGNVPLQVTSIATSGGAWLSASLGSMTVPAGASPDNQATFDVQVNTAGFSTPQFLDGDVYLISNVEPTPPATVDTLTVTVHLLVADTVEPLTWDTVATSTAWDDKSATGAGDNIALSMGNHGEVGQNGILGVNLDFGVDGNDPGDRARDSMYVYTGSMFLLRDDGGSISLTTSIQQIDQATSANGYTTAYSFDPVPDGGSISSGVRNDGSGNIYDSVYTGRMASRDTAVYVERTFYAPRNMGSTFPNFIVVKSKVFTGTKGAQTGLTIGDVMDWDIPTDEPPKNVSATSIAANVTYMQGTVSPDSTFTWDNSQRYGAEAMIAHTTAAEMATDPCVVNADYHGSFGTFQPMMDDSLIAPGVHEPNAQMWLDSIATYDYNSGNSSDTDQTIWMTYMHDFDLGTSDTLYFWTAFATVKQGSASDLEATIAAARDWTFQYPRNCSFGCCLPPTVGDCDQSGAVDITDISVLIDNQFLTLTPLVCEAEGDVDYSGVVDITDLSVLIDNQFLTLTPLGPCP